MKIAYLMEDTDLSGGVRVQMAQADALIARGHEVTIVTKGMPVTWRTSRAEWRYVDHFSQVGGDEFDFVIGTFWTTVAPAYDIARERALHLCQGYEGSFTAYQTVKSQIDEVYRLPIPKLVVSSHLLPIVRQFYPACDYVGQIVEDGFYRDFQPRENRPLRVLMTGALEIDFKGIDIGYGAVTHARYYGSDFHLVRVSPWAPSAAEPVSEHVHEFHVGLSSAEMTRLMHSCDVFLGPSRPEEGFGLPAAEALASSIPAVLTRIPSFLSWDTQPAYALFADAEDAIGLGESLVQILNDPELRIRLARRGREVAEQFRSGNAALKLEQFFQKRQAELAR